MVGLYNCKVIIVVVFASLKKKKMSFILRLLRMDRVEARVQIQQCVSRGQQYHTVRKEMYTLG